MARQREEEVKVLVNEEAEDEGPLCAVSPLPEAVQPVQDLKPADTGKQDSTGLVLDSEVSDVLFHFDTIVTELEKSTLTPRTATPEVRTPTPNQFRELNVVSPDIVVQTTSTGHEMKEEKEKIESELNASQPKLRVRNIQQQFLQNSQRDSTPQVNLRSNETPSSRGNVRSIVAQIQASSRENSPSPASENEGRESPVKQGRSRSSSISQRISMFTQISTEIEVFERKEQPVLPSRKISELTQDFEHKKLTSEPNAQPKTTHIRKKRRSSSLSTKDDAPRILSPPKSSHLRRRTSQESGLTPQKKMSDTSSITPIPLEYTSQEIEEALTELASSVRVNEQPSKTETTREQVEEVRKDSTVHPISLKLTSPTLKIEPAEVSSEPTVPQNISQTNSVSNAKPGTEESRTLSTSSSDVILSPPVEQPYRFRSISDVSHDTRVLTSYRTEGSVTASSSYEHSNEETITEQASVPLKQTPGKKKRNVVSVADPTDIITNLQLAHVPLEESSELTQGLGPETVRRLNQKQDRERIRSPVDGWKRHLRLPFSRGRGKREKYVKLATSPEKTSPKWRGSKPDHRNKRLSRAQADQLLSHNFMPAPIIRGIVCEVCHKGFTGFMKQSQRCGDCGVVVHKHCEYRSPPCKAQIESGSYVTMSRKKIVKALEDLDDLAQFLLHKISLLSSDRCTTSKVDQVFEKALFELHNSLVSNYSLTLQASDQQKDTQTPPTSTVEPRVTITFAQLVNNFTNIFKGIAKRQGLSDPGYLAISINQMKSFLDEFSKQKRRSMAKVMSGGIEPATLRRKAFSGRDLELVDHNGHQFFTEQFKVATVCEYCNDPIPLLEKGDVCLVCGYTCHQSCLKLTTRICEGRDRTKSPPGSKHEAAQSKNQFGVSLESLVPPGSTQIPTVLEKCLQYIEDHGLYVQGIYRKSPGASSKRAVKATLEEDPVGCSLEGFHVNAVAAAVGTFFRELPTPLIPKESYTDLLRTIDLTDRDERLEALHHLLGRLPVLNHAVFERLVFHLARVAQQESTNRMSPYNLAVIFAPCLFQGETKSKNPQDFIKELAKQTAVLQLIIEEQVEKLQVTLRGIETLSVVARDTASKLTELIGAEESPSQVASTVVSGGSVQLRAGPPSSLMQTTENSDKRREEEERERLTSELHEIERERVELTVNLPKLEPFTRDHHASWVIDSRNTTPELDDPSLPSLQTHSLLPALTKNRVSQKPKSRRPTRRPHIESEHDNSSIETSQL